MFFGNGHPEESHGKERGVWEGSFKTIIIRVIYFHFAGSLLDRLEPLELSCSGNIWLCSGVDKLLWSLCIDTWCVEDWADSYCNSEASSTLQVGSFAGLSTSNGAQLSSVSSAPSSYHHIQFFQSPPPLRFLINLLLCALPFEGSGQVLPLEHGLLRLVSCVQPCGGHVMQSYMCINSKVQLNVMNIWMAKQATGSENKVNCKETVLGCKESCMIDQAPSH